MRSSTGTYPWAVVSDAGDTASALLEHLAVLARRAATAHAAERAALDERARAIVAAVRAGARLAEIGAAAGMSRAAVSAIARRSLPARTGRGGPYTRRRGTAAALAEVGEAAARAREEQRRRHDAVLERDRLMVAASENGVPIRVIAETAGVQPAVARELIRRRRSEHTAEGAVASS